MTIVVKPEPPKTDLDRILDEFKSERELQTAEWGVQRHPDGTGPDGVLAGHSFSQLADMIRAAVDEAGKTGTKTWCGIVLEEVFEAMAENDEAKLRRELVQVGALAAAWIAAIDTRVKLEAGHLYLIADEQGTSRLYLIDDDLRPVEQDLTGAPRHGRGALGHGYTNACDAAGEQCNNAMCRSTLMHQRCTVACSGDTYWDALGPWQLAPDQRFAFMQALTAASEAPASA